MGTKRRTNREKPRQVTMLDNTPRRGRPKLWAYGFKTIANASGMTVDSVRKACLSRNNNAPELDPNDFESVIRFVTKRRSYE